MSDTNILLSKMRFGILIDDGFQLVVEEEDFVSYKDAMDRAKEISWDQGCDTLIIHVMTRVSPNKKFTITEYTKE